MRAGLTQALAAMDRFSAPLMLLLVSALCACAPRVRPDIPLGHACFQKFGNPGDTTSYSCAFEISAATIYYDQKKIDADLKSFAKDLPKNCRVVGTERMVDPDMAQVDHAYRLVVAHIECQDGS